MGMGSLPGSGKATLEVPQVRLTEKRYCLSAVAALVLLSAFVICSFFLVRAGGTAYQQLIEKIGSNQELRESISCVADKIRAADTKEPIYLETFEDVDALVIPEKDGYCTYIYYHDGTLKEYSSAAGERPVPENGDILAEVSGFSFSLQQGGKITLQAVNRRGQSVEMVISQRL